MYNHRHLRNKKLLFLEIFHNQIQSELLQKVSKTLTAMANLKAF